MTTETVDAIADSLSVDDNSCISYGCIAQGFVYHLKVNVLNVHHALQRFRFTVSRSQAGDINSITVLSESKDIASGMRAVVTLELSCAECNYSQFTLTVTQSKLQDIIIQRPVRALVVRYDIFRNLQRAWSIQNKPNYAYGVKVIRNLFSSTPAPGGRIMEAAKKKIDPNQETMIDNDDIKEMLELPIVATMYWDPFQKLLKSDAQLLQVHTDSKLTIEEVKLETMRMREDRYQELEDQGFFTMRKIEELRTKFAKALQ